MLIAKYLITAALIVLVSEIAKRNDQFGALIASLPLVTITVLIWLKLENQTAEKISNHAWYTFWYVVPTLPMFALFPWANNQFGFWWALLFSIALTIICFIGWSLFAKQFGVELV